MEQVMGNLFLDEQDVKIMGFCEECGGALYAPSLTCIRCERDGL